MGVIYKITSPTGKVYVGKTYDLRKRINAHRACSRKGSNVILHNSIRKYGLEAHVLEVIEEVEDVLLNEREMLWIAKLNTYSYDNENGLNMTKGGDGQRSTWMHDRNRRVRQSKVFSGSGNPFYGKTHDAATIDIISKKASKRNKDKGIKVPKWGAEKGQQAVRRPVVCYDCMGVFISEYISTTEAANALGVQRSSISECCNGLITAVIGKYVFRYKTENYPLRIDVGEIKKKTERRPIVLMSEDYVEVAEFPSAKEASEFMGVPKTTINRAAQYNWLVPIRTGHVFVYRDVYDVLFEEAI